MFIIFNYSLDQILAYHCAPTLLGCKPSNLVAFRPNENTICDLESMNKFCNPFGIFFEFICSCDNRTLILVYNKRFLTKSIYNNECKKFLLEQGYPMESSLNSILEYLKSRIINDKNFPHEIGIFLGYPLKDIIGFLENKGRNYKLCGYWKVYSDEEHARTLFEKFNECRKIAVRHVENGKPILQLVSA